MMQILRYGDKDEVKELAEKYGGYNDYPPNWQPCTEVEFWHKFMMYSFYAMEHRQMMKPAEVHATMPHKHISGAWLFYYSDGIHLAMVNRVVGARNTIPAYYKFFICDHSHGWEVLESRMCYVKHRCMKCGYTESIDSSD